MISCCYLARMFYEKLQHGCWISLLNEDFEDVGSRLSFDGWCISENSVFNTAEIKFKISNVNAKATAVGFYSNEFDSQLYFAIPLDNSIDLVCDYTYAMFGTKELKVSFN